jgi:SAM-dependent methyltransferase
MRWLTYLRYFLYLGVNWNFRLAFRILGEEIRGERHHQIETTGADSLRRLSKQGIDIRHSTIYMPVSYSLLTKLLSALPVNGRNHLFDYGCGKGRALCVAAHAGFKKVSGVDFSPEFCSKALQNLESTARRIHSFSYQVQQGRAENTELPDDVDCVFLFNPFDETTLNQVLAKVKESNRRQPRPIHLIYVNPLYRNLLARHGFVELYHTREMVYLEGILAVSN